jgi:hypothetical protein
VPLAQGGTLTRRRQSGGGSLERLQEHLSWSDLVEPLPNRSLEVEPGFVERESFGHDIAHAQAPDDDRKGAA